MMEIDQDDDSVCVPKQFKKISSTCTSSLVNYESRFNPDSRSSTNETETLIDLNNNYLNSDVNNRNSCLDDIDVYCICKSSDVDQFMM